MDDETTLVLALQFVALFSIVAALLAYLLCKIRATEAEVFGYMPGAGKAVLVTSADNAIGLQIAVHLANRGFRVFAGLKDGGASLTGSQEDSVSSRVIRAWQKYRESLTGCQGALVALPLDVTREDLLHEAVDIIRAHLPAGADGIWAVINTSGLSYRGRLEQQDIAHWDAIMKTNVIGVLRTARTFQALLRNTSGRIINFGLPDSTEAGLVAYTAARYAVEGASKALREELSPLGIKVITLQFAKTSPELLFATPKIKTEEKHDGDGEISVDIAGSIEFQPRILQEGALDILDVAVRTATPKNNYTLTPKNTWIRSSLAKVV